MRRASIVRVGWWIGLILSAIVIAFVLVRAMTIRQATRRLTDPAAMKAAVAQALPSGSSLVDAERFMVQEGFQCFRTTNADFAEQDRVYHHIDYVSCDRTDSAGFPVTRRWQIALVYENDRISDVLVSAGLTGP